MFLPFFEALRRTGVPVSLREYLAFLDGMAAGLARCDAEAFRFPARTVLVKDERHLDGTIHPIRRIFDGRMVPMTLDSPVRAMREVAR